MLPDERSPHEPDEPDLGPDIPDVAPEESGSEFGPEIPTVAPPDGGFFGPSDTPTELLKAFWTLVVLFNVGLLGTSLGLMLLGFRGRLFLGGGLLAVGLLALSRGIYRYRALDFDSFDEDND